MFVTYLHEIYLLYVIYTNSVPTSITSQYTDRHVYRPMCMCLCVTGLAGSHHWQSVYEKTDCNNSIVTLTLQVVFIFSKFTDT